jgi:hypothetical protein
MYYERPYITTEPELGRDETTISRPEVTVAKTMMSIIGFSLAFLVNTPSMLNGLPLGLFSTIPMVA